MVDNKKPHAKLGFHRKLRKATALNFSEWVELIIASEALLEARIIFARTPAKFLVARLKEPVGNTQSRAFDETAEDQLKRLEWALAAAANVLPWRTDCLIRCIAADKILRRRKLEPNFYLGVRNAPDEDFGAHAWIRCHGIPVAGGEGKEFEVLISPNQEND